MGLIRTLTKKQSSGSASNAPAPAAPAMPAPSLIDAASPPQPGRRASSYLSSRKRGLLAQR